MTVKEIIRKFWFWLVITFVSIALLLILFLNLLPLSTPYLNKHIQIIENFASKMLDQPTYIGAVKLGHKGLDPVLYLSDVELRNDANTLQLVKIKELDIGISFYQSLRKLSLTSNYLSVSGAKLAFYQDVDGSVTFAEPNNPQAIDASKPKTNNAVTLADVLEWLFTQNQIELKDLVVDWYDSNKDVLTVNIANLSLHPGAEMKRAAVTAKNKGIVLKTPSSLSFKLKLGQKNFHFESPKMKPGLITWLNNAFAKEDLIEGTIEPFGLIHDASDTNKNFFIALKLKGVNLNYCQGWPALTNLDTVLLYDGTTLKIVANAGKINGMPFTYAEAEIAKTNDIYVLNVTSKVNTDMEQGYKFIAASPLKEPLQAKLAGLILHGPLNLDLKLMIPLGGNNHIPTVDGNILFQNNTALAKNLDVSIDNLTGKLHFSHQEIDAEQLSGKFLERPVAIKIVTLPQKNSSYSITKMSMLGEIDLGNALAKLLPAAFSSKITGVTDYNATLTLHDGHEKVNNEWQVISNLTGISIDLPAPLTKSALNVVPLNLNFEFKNQAASEINIKYGNALETNIAFESVSLPKANPSKLVKLAVKVKTSLVDWKIWHNYFAPYYTSQAPKTTATNFDTNKATRFSLQKLDAEFADLEIFGQSLKPASVSINLGDKNTHPSMHFVSPKVNGNLIFSSEGGDLFLAGQFSRLYLQANDENISTIDLKKIIPFSLSSADFRYNDKNIGSVAIKVLPTKAGLHISDFNISSPQFDMNATGAWEVAATDNNKQKSMLKGLINVKDLGGFLKTWNLGENVEKGSGDASFNIWWYDSFLSPSLANLEGKMQLKFKHGSIINLDKSTEAELGLGKFLNLLSLQSFAQNFILNFSDMVSKGFVFDTLTADWDLKNGSLYTNNTLLQGQVASVLAKGRVGFRNKDYDLKMTITPVMTASFPVVATIFGGPVAGAITWLADKVVDVGVTSVTSSVITVKGPWSKPTITKASSKSTTK